MGNAKTSADEGLWFIHIVDPGFPDPPWPGERRLGPFLTHAEAFSQAVNDVAHGHVAEDGMIGVYAEEDSVKRRDAAAQAFAGHDPAEGAFDPRGLTRAGRPKRAPETIAKAAVKQREKMLRLRAEAVEDQRSALAAMLPDGMDVDAFIKSAHAAATAARAAALATETEDQE